MKRPPVTANPWLIALMAVWLIGAAFIFTKAARLEQPLSQPTRSNTR